MDRVLIRDMATELGVSSATLDPLRRLPFEQALVALDQLKAAAKAKFKELALKYHPDHNQDDIEGSTQKFKALLAARDAVEGLRIKRQVRQVQRTYTGVRRRPNVPHSHPVGTGGASVSYFPAGFGFGGVTAATNATSTSGYDARRVIFVRFVS